DLSAATTSSLWQGLDLDADLGWYYARNRWYDPNIGSFVSVDPLGYPDSANTYIWGIGSAWEGDPMGPDGNDGSYDPTYIRQLQQEAAEMEKAAALKRGPTISAIKGNRLRGALYWALDTAIPVGLSDEKANYKPLYGAGQPAADLRQFKKDFSKE